MKKFVLITLALLLPLFALQGQNKYALVIGNGAYTNVPRLSNPTNDAADMKGVLEGLGFSVDIVQNGSLEQMENALIRLKNRLEQQPENSYGFFFYAGHGVQSDGNNYLIPVDADIKSESFLKTKALVVQNVLDELQAAKNKLNIVVLDACRDNPFGWSRGGTRGLSNVAIQPPGSIIMYATGAGKAAADGDGRNGLFTGQLLNNLKTPGLDVNEIFRRTGLDVQRVSQNQQVPAIYSQFFEIAYFNPASTAGQVTIPTSAIPANPATPQQPSVSSNPFITGRWQGRTSYKDADGIQRSDLYEIVFVPNGTCIVTLTTKENGKDLMQDGDGLWSYDKDFLRVECDFMNPVIARLSGIRWVSMYQLNDTRTRFTLLVPPYEGAKNNVGIALVQVRE
ncbi:hypothetical protein AGMMS49546_35880 [Spirochaetia bacterium]|nr:hypothetical protein AGMMS49546_35880 [Spirochaetia bacterium]